MKSTVLYVVIQTAVHDQMNNLAFGAEIKNKKKKKTKQKLRLFKT
jgi:hypothetical protein